MGEAHAKAFVAEGAKLILTDINAIAGAALAKSLGSDAMFVPHDVASSTGWARVVSQGEAHFGRINVLVNNAGIIGPVARTADIAERDFAHVCAVSAWDDQAGCGRIWRAQHPGYVKTPMMVAATDQDGGGAACDIPVRRFAEAHEISPLVVFLASDESSFITGMEHVIDGGMTAC